MRITNVEADIVRIPLSTRFSGSVYQIESRCTIVVRVHTDEGLASEVYSGDERTGYQLLKDLVVGPMAEVVKGEDPMAIERCWQKMFALTPHIGDKAIAMRAIAAIDIALWDIAGKALGVPVRTMLGGYAERSPVVRFAYYVQGRGHGVHGGGSGASEGAGHWRREAEGWRRGRGRRSAAGAGDTGHAG